MGASGALTRRVRYGALEKYFVIIVVLSQRGTETPIRAG